MILGMSFSAAAISAEWTYNSEISLGLQYTDNLFFTSANSVTGNTADTFIIVLPTFSILAESETSRTLLNFGVSVERYDSVTSANRNDPYVRFNWDNTLETSQFGLGAQYRQSSTRTSELETTGQVNIFGTQTRSTIEPYWQMNVTESNSLQLGVSLTSVSYDIDSLINYENYGFLTGWFYEYSEISTLNINMDLRRFDSEDAGVDFDYGSLLAGIDYDVSEAFNLNLNVGVGYGLREVGENYSTGLINASIAYQKEYYSTSLRLSSSLVPSGQADLRQVHALTFLYDHQISELLAFNFNAGLSESFPIDDPDAVRNEVFNVRPGLNFRMARDWYFDTWYLYRSNREIGREDRAENSGYIGIRWRTE